MSKINISVASLVLNVAILSLAAVFFFSSGEKNSTGNINGIHQAANCLGGDFILKSAKGPVSLVDYRGKVVVLYFGYASCPDVCPTSLGLLSLALRQLSADELSKLQVMFISVDPDRDSVENLEKYAKAFHPNIVGLTGTAKEIADIAKHYGVMYAKVEMVNSALGYTVDHSSRYYVVGKDGAVKKIIEHGTSPKEIADNLRSVM